MDNGIVLDIETTGVTPEDRVIEIAITDLKTDEILLHSRVNPERPIPAVVTEITKITDEMVANAPKFAEIAANVRDIIARAEAVVGYNIAFDQRIIGIELTRCRLDLKWPAMICAKRVWDIYEPRDSRNLTNAFIRFVDNDSTAFVGTHGALNDTLACARVFRAQITRFDLAGKSWFEIDPEQKTWWGPTNHIIWCNDRMTVNFGKHKGSPIVMVDKGFWRWIQKKDFPEHVMMLADYIVLVAKDPVNEENLITWARERNL